MNFTIPIKKLLSETFYRFGLFAYKLNQYYRSGQYLILMYHRVTPPDNRIQAGMYVKPESFFHHIKLLKKYFNIIPLKDLEIKKEENRKKTHSKPLCILTFDDGWKDFYDYAFPILKLSRVPATVFIPTSFIGSKRQFWTDEFAYLLSHRIEKTPCKVPNLRAHKAVQYILKLQGGFEHQLECGIEHLKCYPIHDINNIIKSLYEIWGVDHSKMERVFLNWSEINEMIQSGLISFGSHTVNHQILTTVEPTEIKKELNISHNELLKKNIVDDSFIPFCYPNGNFTKKIAGLVRSSGYHMAVTTVNGWNHNDNDKFCLKRIGIHDDMTSTTALFACRIIGLL